jgi:SPW repeat
MPEHVAMGTHPDILALHARYESASETVAGQVVGGTTFLAGVYLAISPWVVGFNDQSPLLVNNLLVGVAVALLGLGLTASFDRFHRLAWTVPVLGIWAIVSPWAVRAGGLARADNIWNNVITGAVILAAGLAIAALAMRRNEIGWDEGSRSEAARRP